MWASEACIALYFSSNKLCAGQAVWDPAQQAGCLLREDRLGKDLLALVIRFCSRVRLTCCFTNEGSVLLLLHHLVSILSSSFSKPLFLLNMQSVHTQEPRQQTLSTTRRNEYSQPSNTCEYDMYSSVASSARSI